MSEKKITVSMNGLRRTLTRDLRSLANLMRHLLTTGDYDKEELCDALNDVIYTSNTLNCVYNPADENFSDISDVFVEAIDLSDLDN